jgi:hypothetical protein
MLYRRNSYSTVHNIRYSLSSSTPTGDHGVQKTAETYPIFMYQFMCQSYLILNFWRLFCRLRSPPSLFHRWEFYDPCPPCEKARDGERALKVSLSRLLFEGGGGTRVVNSEEGASFRRHLFASVLSATFFHVFNFDEGLQILGRDPVNFLSFRMISVQKELNIYWCTEISSP